MVKTIAVRSEKRMPQSFSLSNLERKKLASLIPSHAATEKATVDLKKKVITFYESGAPINVALNPELSTFPRANQNIEKTHDLFSQHIANLQSSLMNSPIYREISRLRLIAKAQGGVSAELHELGCLVELEEAYLALADRKKLLIESQKKQIDQYKTAIAILKETIRLQKMRMQFEELEETDETLEDLQEALAKLEHALQIKHTRLNALHAEQKHLENVGPSFFPLFQDHYPHLIQMATEISAKESTFREYLQSIIAEKLEQIKTKIS